MSKIDGGDLMYCISINYRKADASIRGLFSMSKDQRSELRRKLGNSVIICTCNRTEIYFTDINVRDATGILSEFREYKNITDYLCVYEASGAIRHLFRVSCGIDSMIIGEDEILRQVKEAYLEAKETGNTDHKLNIIFQSAISAAKRIKTETDLSKISVSAATIAANEAIKYGRNILIIGASGKIGTSTLKNLMSHEGIDIIQTTRSHSLGTLCIENVRTVPYSERYRYADNADCIISATSSPHFTLTSDRLKKAFTIDKPRLLIDLAVPHDIENTVTEIHGVRLMDIDEIGMIAKHGNELKISASERAEIIISEELDELLKKLVFLRFIPVLDNIRSTAESISFDKLLYKLRDGLNSEQFSAVLDILETLEGQ